MNRIERELAESLVAGVDGVTEVRSEIRVDADARLSQQGQQCDHEGGRSFGSWVDDSTTTAAVRSRFLDNPSMDGHRIEVEARGDLVTLRGRVDSETKKRLAGEIARNTGGVREVRNDLVVQTQ
jgi:hyperosmotically inducible protein